MVWLSVALVDARLLGWVERHPGERLVDLVGQQWRLGLAWLDPEQWTFWLIFEVRYISGRVSNFLILVGYLSTGLFGLTCSTWIVF